MHHRLTRLISTLCLCLFPLGARAEPGAAWQTSAPAAWSETAQHELAAYGAAEHPTALMVIKDGQIAAEWGEVAEPVNVYSVRKSLLNALIGIAVAKGQIHLDATLADLGIDDKPPGLTPDERQAVVGDLLKARSGIYHPAAFETNEMQEKRPARGSHAHGTFWFYNNWDFNALGGIYSQATREDIFESFRRRIARPIGMQDFVVDACHYVHDAISTFPAYTFTVSARDLARFGLLYLNDGRWNGSQIVPSDWVRASVTAYSTTDRSGGRGYGYLWWTVTDVSPGAFMASGNYGQYIIVDPAKRLVFVQTYDRKGSSQRVKSRDFIALARTITSQAP
jgi:CubicO group peptidase (beta-lactamase class C family)